MLPETPRRSRSSQSTPFPHASPSSPVSNESDDSDLSSNLQQSQNASKLNRLPLKMCVNILTSRCCKFSRTLLTASSYMLLQSVNRYATHKFLYTPQSLIPEIAFGTYLHLLFIMQSCKF